MTKTNSNPYPHGHPDIWLDQTVHEDVKRVLLKEDGVPGFVAILVVYTVMMILICWPRRK